MRKSKVSKIWIPAFLLAALVAGCGDSDKNAGGPLTPPTVLSVTPTAGIMNACQTTPVTATFSKAMNPATITANTFTLTTGGVAVPAAAGSPSLDATGTVATFTPLNTLALNTPYTATITTGAQDPFGNGLAQPFTWMFTTRATACPAPITIAPELCGIGILAGTAITNAAGPSIVKGDVDISPNNAAAVTGFPPGTFTGMEHAADATAAAAQNRLTTAYVTAMTLPPGTLIGGSNGEIGGQTLPPGVYTRTTASGAGGPSLQITGNLTLDPVGDPNAVWIFQIESTLITGGAGVVTVLGPGKPGNVFWEIGSAATLGVNTTMAGNLMAMAAVTFNGNNVLNGRVLVRTTGAATINNTTINVPACGP
jgi:ice-binding like protein/Big-like domain-containing protein